MAAPQMVMGSWGVVGWVSLFPGAAGQGSVWGGKGRRLQGDSHATGSDLRTVCPALTRALKGAEVPAVSGWHGPAGVSRVTAHPWATGTGRG